MKGHYVFWKKQSKATRFGYVWADHPSQAFDIIQELVGKTRLLACCTEFTAVLRSKMLIRSGLVYGYKVKKYPHKQTALSAAITIPIAEEGMRLFCFRWPHGGRPGAGFGYGAVVHETEAEARAFLLRTVMLQGDMDRFNDVLQAEPTERLQVYVKHEQEIQATPSIFWLRY